jgi:hypothetical protein
MLDADWGVSGVTSSPFCGCLAETAAALGPARWMQERQEAGQGVVGGFACSVGRHLDLLCVLLVVCLCRTAVVPAQQQLPCLVCWRLCRTAVVLAQQQLLFCWLSVVSHCRGTSTAAASMSCWLSVCVALPWYRHSSSFHVLSAGVCQTVCHTAVVGVQQQLLPPDLMSLASVVAPGVYRLLVTPCNGVCMRWRVGGWCVWQTPLVRHIVQPPQYAATCQQQQLHLS